MVLLDKNKALRSLPKTVALLRYILQDVTQEQAVNSWDGDWNVVYVVCHLRDLEAAYLERVRRMLREENPTFRDHDHQAGATANNYAGADLGAALAQHD